MDYVYLVYEQDVEYAMVEDLERAYSKLEDAMEYVRTKYSVELDAKAIEKEVIKPEQIAEWKRVYIWKVKVY